MHECSRVTIEGWPLESGAVAHTTFILPRLYFELAPHDPQPRSLRLSYESIIWCTYLTVWLQGQNETVNPFGGSQTDVYDFQEKVFSVGNNLCWYCLRKHPFWGALTKSGLNKKWLSPNKRQLDETRSDVINSSTDYGECHATAGRELCDMSYSILSEALSYIRALSDSWHINTRGNAKLCCDTWDRSFF